MFRRLFMFALAIVFLHQDLVCAFPRQGATLTRNPPSPLFFQHEALVPRLVSPLRSFATFVKARLFHSATQQTLGPDPREGVTAKRIGTKSHSRKVLEQHAIQWEKEGLIGSIPQSVVAKWRIQAEQRLIKKPPTELHRHAVGEFRRALNEMVYFAPNGRKSVEIVAVGDRDWKELLPADPEQGTESLKVFALPTEDEGRVPGSIQWRVYVPAGLLDSPDVAIPIQVLHEIVEGLYGHEHWVTSVYEFLAFAPVDFLGELTPPRLAWELGLAVIARDRTYLMNLRNSAYENIPEARERKRSMPDVWRMARLFAEQLTHDADRALNALDPQPADVPEVHSGLRLLPSSRPSSSRVRPFGPSKSLATVSEVEIHRAITRSIQEGTAIAFDLNKDWGYYFGQDLSLEQMAERLTEWIVDLSPTAKQALAQELNKRSLRDHLRASHRLLERAIRTSSRQRTLRKRRYVISWTNDPHFLSAQVLEHAGSRTGFKDRNGQGIPTIYLPIQVLDFVEENSAYAQLFLQVIQHADFHLRGEPKAEWHEGHPYFSVGEYRDTQAFFMKYREHQSDILVKPMDFLTFEELKARIQALGQLGLITNIEFIPNPTTSERAPGFQISLDPPKTDWARLLAVLSGNPTDTFYAIEILPDSKMARVRMHGAAYRTDSPSPPLGMGSWWFKFFPLLLADMRSRGLSDRQIAQELGMFEEIFFHSVLGVAFVFSFGLFHQDPSTSFWAAAIVRGLFFAMVHRQVVSMDAQDRFAPWRTATWKDHVRLQGLSLLASVAGVKGALLVAPWITQVLVNFQWESWPVLLVSAWFFGLLLAMLVHALYNRWAPDPWARGMIWKDTPPPGKGQGPFGQAVSREEFLEVLNTLLENNEIRKIDWYVLISDMKRNVSSLTESQWAMRQWSQNLVIWLRQIHDLTKSENFRLEIIGIGIVLLTRDLEKAKAFEDLSYQLTESEIQWLNGEATFEDPLQKAVYDLWKWLLEEWGRAAVEESEYSQDEVMGTISSGFLQLFRARHSSQAVINQLLLFDAFPFDWLPDNIGLSLENERVVQAISRFRQMMQKTDAAGTDKILIISIKDTLVWWFVGEFGYPPPLYRYVRFRDERGEEKSVLLVRFDGGSLYELVARLGALVAAKPWSTDSEGNTATPFGAFLQEGALLLAQKEIIGHLAEMPGLESTLGIIRDFTWNIETDDLETTEIERESGALGFLHWPLAVSLEYSFVKALYGEDFDLHAALTILSGNHSPLKEALGADVYEALKFSFVVADYPDSFQNLEMSSVGEERVRKGIFYKILLEMLVNPYRKKSLPAHWQEKLEFFWDLVMPLIVDSERNIDAAEMVDTFAAQGRMLLAGDSTEDDVRSELDDWRTDPGNETFESASISRLPSRLQWLGLLSLVWLEEIVHLLVAYGWKEGVRRAWFERRGIYRGRVRGSADGMKRVSGSQIAGPLISGVVGFGLFASVSPVFSFIGAFTLLRLAIDISLVPFLSQHELRPTYNRLKNLAQAA